MATNPLVGLRLPTDVRRWLKREAADHESTLTAVATRVFRAEMARTVQTPPEGVDASRVAEWARFAETSGS